MPLLWSLRNAHHLILIVLVWFTLFIGLAVASPVFNPKDVQLVCSTVGSVKLVQLDADGQETPGIEGLHCPLCLPVATPTSMAVQVPVHAGLSYALIPVEQAQLASLIGLPWQARAPPSFF